MNDFTKYLAQLVVAMTTISCGYKPTGVERPADSEVVMNSNPGSGEVVATLNEVNCTQTTRRSIYYVEESEQLYYCNSSNELVQLQTGSNVSDTIGSTGPQGPAGVGYERNPLTGLYSTDITSIASNNTGTNAYAAGTGFAAPNNLANINDTADFDRTELALATTYSQAVLGMTNNFGCYQFDLGALGGTSQMLFGVAAAKIGIRATANTATTIQWMFSPTAAANSYYLAGADSATATATETVIYPTTTFFSRFLALCVRGSTSRNITVRFYQLEIRK